MAFVHSDVRAYYTTAIAGLRFVEARKVTNRRFGPDADARWSSFRGDLTTADRIDLLVRDADAEWPGAFGARTVFAQPAVAEDDAFGPSWTPLDPVDAEEVWHSVLSAPSPSKVDALIAAWARAWGETIEPFDLGGSLQRAVVAGPSAIAATLRALAAQPDVAWADQITVLATPPAHRQLAALGAAVLNVTRPTTLLTASQASQARSLVGRVLVSDDASADDGAAARAAAS